jgi:deoxycytidylate deaminase
LSEELKAKFRAEHNRTHNDRKELQDYGNSLREESPPILSDAIISTIKEQHSSCPGDGYVVDSIRNPAEIKALREAFPNFVLVAVFADYSTRWERVRDTYGGSKDSFDADELRDKGTYEPIHGQHISKCFFEADLILSNNKHINVKTPEQKTYLEMKNTIDNYMRAFEEPTSSEPTIDESLMAIAYAIGRRSKCKKRRVGAIIVDDSHNILSSGFNGVPKGLLDCSNEHGDCYRDSHRDKLRGNIAADIAKSAVKAIGEECPKIDKETKDSIEEKTKRVAESISTDIVKRIKVLELCRSLHAEENAIMNLVGTSKTYSFENCSLYASTYPCNLCANKIAQTGIKKVIYLEPYPVEDAKIIFDSADVAAKPFVGITFRAFFRAFSYSP